MSKTTLRITFVYCGAYIAVVYVLYHKCYIIAVHINISSNAMYFYVASVIVCICTIHKDLCKCRKKSQYYKTLL